MSSSASPADWPIAKLNSTFNSVRGIELICDIQRGRRRRSRAERRSRGGEELQQQQVEVSHQGVYVGDGLPPVVEGGVLCTCHLEEETDRQFH